ncbi:MAG: MATE family efflux transporter [Firmicutes bacterium]|nr:MATE family efflux transporter [Bacillota bacterium]
MAKNMKVNSKNDLTEGPIFGKLIGFAIPVILGNLCFQLYNVVDSIVVGNYVGTDALAAVGAVFPIMMLFNALFMGVSMGAQIVISQTFGAKDEEGLRTVTNTSIALAIIIGAAITAIGTPLAKPMLRLIKTPANIINNSSTYLMIIFAGTLGNVFYNLGSGALRGLGDSRWPLVAMLVSSVTNIILDQVFVIYFDMGVAGVAWATTIAHFLSGMIPLWRIQSGAYPVRLYMKDILHPDGIASRRIFQLGLPSSIQNAAMSLGSVVIQSFANSFGSNFIAANTINMKADGFAIMPMMGLGMSSTSFVGQNIGAGKIDRAKKGVHAGQLSAIVVAVVVGAALFAFGKYIMQAFGADGQVLMMGVSGIRFLAFCYVFVGLDQVTGGAMRGAGAAIAPAITSISANLIRIPLAYFLGAGPLRTEIRQILAAKTAELSTKATEFFATGAYSTMEEAEQSAAAVLAAPNHFMNMFYAMGISMFVGALLIYLYFKFGKWQEKSIIKTYDD